MIAVLVESYISRQKAEVPRGDAGRERFAEPAALRSGLRGDPPEVGGGRGGVLACITQLGHI